VTSSTRTLRSKTIRLTAIGLAATTLCVGGAGLAAAANPSSSFGQAVGTAAHAAGVDWSDMPEGYTQAQYEAFWGAGYSPEDQEALEELWSLESTEAKARAGQMILDGEQLPFEPGTHTTPELPADEQTAIDAFFDAGYTVEDVATLNDLWDTDNVETKSRAGQMLLDGEELPIDPADAATSAAN
jgi:aryl-alcohol dehydrogenase-like predicted oxidoreductase